jgi:hypothetical protein
MYGKAPQNANPVRPRINNLGNSINISFHCFLSEGNMKGKRIIAARTHRQNAKDTGGTNPAAPRATAIFPVIKIG